MTFTIDNLFLTLKYIYMIIMISILLIELGQKDTNSIEKLLNKLTYYQSFILIFIPFNVITQVFTHIISIVV